MKKQNLLKIWVLAAVCAVLFALLCMTGMLDKQQIWPGVELVYEQDKHVFSLEAGDAYGYVTQGPYTELPAGRYRIKWQIEGDGVNAVQLQCSNDVAIEPFRFETTPGDFEGEAYFTLADTVHNFSIRTEFCDGTWMKVHNFRLYTPVYTDHYFTLAALMLSAVLLAWLHAKGKLPPARREILVPLALAVLFASVPALRDEAIYTFDVPFHAARLHNLADSLQSGQFPGRVGGYTYNGYGAVTSVFYPDLLLYPFALMLMLGASMTYVLNVLVIVTNALTAVCMYAAGKRIFDSRQAGAFASIIYVLCGFRLDRFYGSFMVGQMLAMAFLPVFLLGLWEVFFGEKERWLLLAVGATLIFQSHMLTTVLCAAIAAAAVVCYGVRLVRERRAGAVLLAVVTTLVINLTTLVPIVTTYFGGVTTTVGTYGFVGLTHKAVQMLGTDKELGLAIFLGLSALLCCAENQPEKRFRPDIVRLLVMGVISLWLCTDLFPWNYVFAVTDIVEYLQFPWRFLVVGTVCLSLCAGLGFACLLRGQGAKGLFAVLAVAVLSVSPVIEHALEMETIDFGQDGSPYILTPEYQFEGTDLEITRSRQVITEGDVELTAYEKDGTDVRMSVSAKTDAEICVPLFAFDGYAAELDGERVQWTRGKNNRLTVQIPAGTQGELRVWYEGILLWRIADVVSLAGLAVLIVYCRRRRGIWKRDGGKAQ